MNWEVNIYTQKCISLILTESSQNWDQCIAIETENTVSWLSTLSRNNSWQTPGTIRSLQTFRIPPSSWVFIHGWHPLTECLPLPALIYRGKKTTSLIRRHTWSIIYHGAQCPKRLLQALTRGLLEAPLTTLFAQKHYIFFFLSLKEPPALTPLGCHSIFFIWNTSYFRRVPLILKTGLKTPG